MKLPYFEYVISSTVPGYKYFFVDTVRLFALYIYCLLFYAFPVLAICSVINTFDLLHIQTIYMTGINVDTNVSNTKYFCDTRSSRGPLYIANFRFSHLIILCHIR